MTIKLSFILAAPQIKIGGFNKAVRDLKFGGVQIKFLKILSGKIKELGEFL